MERPSRGERWSGVDRKGNKVDRVGEERLRRVYLSGKARERERRSGVDGTGNNVDRVGLT